VELPECSDLFGAKRSCAMRGLRLPEPQAGQLAQNLEMLGELQKGITDLEKQLEALCRGNKDMALLKSIPGLGKVLACVIGSEIDGIARFETKARFIGYCGLAPTTHGSAGNFYQGRMITQCNRWLKWAFIEAAWVAIGMGGGAIGTGGGAIGMGGDVPGGLGRRFAGNSGGGVLHFYPSARFSLAHVRSSP
jgi:transposase